MDNTLRVGDIVKLKSGGPLMTVQDVLDKGKVNCVWFPHDDCEPMHLTNMSPSALERQSTAKHGQQPSDGS